MYSSWPNFALIVIYCHNSALFDQILKFGQLLYPPCSPRARPSLACDTPTICQISPGSVYCVAIEGRKTMNSTVFSTSTFSGGATWRQETKLNAGVYNYKPSHIQRYQKRFHIQTFCFAGEVIITNSTVQKLDKKKQKMYRTLQTR